MAELASDFRVVFVCRVSLSFNDFHSGSEWFNVWGDTPID